MDGGPLATILSSRRNAHLHVHKVRALALLLVDHHATALVHAVVDAARGVLRGRDVDQEDRLLQRRAGRQVAREDLPR